MKYYRKTPNKGPPPINAPPLPPRPHVKSIFAFLAICQPKMVRFSFCKKLLKGENALFKAIKFANAHVESVTKSYQKSISPG